MYSLLLLNVVIVNACTCYSLLQFVSLLSLMVLLLAYWYVVNIAVSCHYHIYSSTVDFSLLLFPCVVSLAYWLLRLYLLVLLSLMLLMFIPLHIHLGSDLLPSCAAVGS